MTNFAETRVTDDRSRCAGGNDGHAFVCDTDDPRVLVALALSVSRGVRVDRVWSSWRTDSFDIQ